MTHAYEREPYRTQLDARVVRQGEDSGRIYVILDGEVTPGEGAGCEPAALGPRTLVVSIVPSRLATATASPTRTRPEKTRPMARRPR